MKKLKFKPEIVRIKLNPEQAVLTCSCYNTGWYITETGSYPTHTACYGPGKAGTKLVMCFANTGAT